MTKLKVLCISGNPLCSRVPKYDNAVQKLFHQQVVIDPDILKDFSLFPEMDQICYPEMGERGGSIVVDLTGTNVNSGIIEENK